MMITTWIEWKKYILITKVFQENGLHSVKEKLKAQIYYYQVTNFIMKFLAKQIQKNNFERNAIWNEME